MSIKKIERLPNINEDGGVGIVIDINDSISIKIYYKIIINFSILTKCFCYCIIQDISQKVRQRDTLRW